MAVMVGFAVYVTIAIALAFWVAELAGERGQPRGPWFVVALFLPIVSLLVVLVAFPAPTSRRVTRDDTGRFDLTPA